MINSNRFIHLDALRGISAIIVMIGHIRGFIIVDFGDSSSSDLIDKMIYFSTGLGHSAVIAFFALSGFLVGGSAIDSLSSGRWSTSHFIIARLSRMWTVILPALVLTLILDSLGIWLNDGVGYDGRFWHLLSSGPSVSEPPDSGPLTFLGNAFFLQTVSVPVLGSNGPLWSLANEFWYYVLFTALAWVILARARLVVRALVALSVIAVAALLPGPLLALGAIWVAGAFGHAVLSWGPAVRFLERPLVCNVLLGIVLATLMARHGFAADLLQGLAWALALPSLALARQPDGRLAGVYRRIAIALSEISFTLYATHFPLLALLYFTLLAPLQMLPDMTALLVGTALAGAAIAQAAVMWWLFERHTPAVRSFGMRMLAGRLRQ